MKFYPYKKGVGMRKSFIHAEGCVCVGGGGITSVGVLLTQVLEVLAILEGGGGGGCTQKVSTL